jgi:hypothetical protein
VVTAAHAAKYPKDQATGFKEGDLRGWFWVEVPPSASTSANLPSKNTDAAK